jgi:hypothetical protein
MIENVTIFLNTKVPKDTPIFPQIISSGCGALLTFIFSYFRVLSSRIVKSVVFRQQLRIYLILDVSICGFRSLIISAVWLN